jgi:predicted translin family RNA/ssDNA-binding protein
MLGRECLQVQEYVEAATFCRFCNTGTRLSLAEINESLLALSDQSVEPLQINVLDYLLGVNTLILLPLMLMPHFPLLPQ